MNSYDPKTLEQKWYQYWENNDLFQASGKGEPYCIMLPPPNVTGTLHMGHGFQMTLIDALIRYHRMQGFNTLWQVGTDHAGIATQMVVERLLLQEGTTRQEIGRKNFTARVWEWKNHSDNIIKKQMRRLGVSADWERERFTMDESICRAVIEVFVHLYEEGLIYRGKRLVNWDPVLHTAISDLEVVVEEQQGNLWYINYPLTDGSGQITVATSRPETLFGDVAIAVHPDDQRYKELIGKKVHIPLTDREIPIISDPAVEQEFGTGCVKITPAHDFNDYAMAQRHKLPMINVFTVDARMNNEVPKKYQDLDRFRARELVVDDLTAGKYIQKIEKYIIKIPKGDRSNAIIEPYLTDQWFMSMRGFAESAITAAKKSQIKFIPEHWTKIYFQWLENIQDWCISRQLWWGHRIPAWYDDKQNVYVGHSEAEVRKKHKLPASTKLQQDNDVLDTWFSAALWPFATLDWPEQTAEFKTFYPTNVLVTGFDIIFFWVARMVMLGLHFTGKVPFKEVYITGLIRDAEGQKMSKSKGNILDPIDLIDGISLPELVKKRTMGLMQPQMAERIKNNTCKEFPEGIPSYGTDALRFTFCALASPGREIRFDLGRLEGYRNFCNKIWNAARFVLMNVKDFEYQNKNNEFNLKDQWIRSRLNEVIKTIHDDFKNYRFDLMANTLYEFIWNEFCDWYLEFSKPILNTEDFSKQQKHATQLTLLEVLETILRLIHPIMPFISEEIWQQIAPLIDKKDKSITLQHFPQISEQETNPAAETEMEWLKKIILAIRNIRGEMNISPKQTLTLLIPKNIQPKVENNALFLKTLAKLAAIEPIEDQTPLTDTATFIIDDIQYYVPFANAIDKNAENLRLQKELAKCEKDLQLIKSRLDNPNFVARAPKEIIQKEQQRLEELQNMFDKLTCSLDEAKRNQGK